MSGSRTTDWHLDHHVALESDAEAAPESYTDSMAGASSAAAGVAASAGAAATAPSLVVPRLASAARPPAPAL